MTDVPGDHAVVYFGEPTHSGYVLIKRDHLVNATSLEHERWKRAHPEALPEDKDRAARPRPFDFAAQVEPLTAPC